MSNCSICGKKIGLIEPSAIIKGGSLCLDCINRAGYSRDSSYDANLLASLTIDEANDIFAKDKEMQTLMSAVNTEAGIFARFDDTGRTAFFLAEPIATPHPHNYTAIPYDQIVSYELIEDGATVQTDAFGAAAVGGLMFGAAGAIVGSASGMSKPVCNSLILKMIINNNSEPAFYVKLINSGVDRRSQKYKDALTIAHDISSKLHLIIESNNKSSKGNDVDAKQVVDPVAEIRRYKDLFDEGILTEEEFIAKKRMMLGI